MTLRRPNPCWPPEAQLGTLLWYLANKGPCRAPLHRLRWSITADGHPQFELGELVQPPATRSRRRRKHSQGTGVVPTPTTEPADTDLPTVAAATARK